MVYFSEGGLKLIKTGILDVDFGNGIIQRWIISESKRHTYIMITDKDGKILGWDKFDYMGWWID